MAVLRVPGDQTYTVVSLRAQATLQKLREKASLAEQEGNKNEQEGKNSTSLST